MKPKTPLPSRRRYYRPSPSPPSSPVFYGPSNPYNPAMVKGRQKQHWNWAKKDPRTLSTLLFTDEVSCHIEMGYNKGLTTSRYDPKDPFMDYQDGSRYELYLTVTIPCMPPSAFPAVHPLIWDSESPRAILDSCYFAKNSAQSPDWCRSMNIGDSHTFSQPRCAMSDAFACMAFWDQNRCQLTEVMIEWA
ncbi:hypothetical protein C8J56DRAFT_1056111 [Mycena floridula]|nr:hypothetical protein C8J56DRAFT_1056111 [Mycena floridula]